jgi:allantoate deiminase
VTDRNGISYAEAVKAYGKLLPPIRLAAYTRTEALAYVELHIEQGPVLEAKGQPLGVVTAIVGQNRLRVTVTGQASHAGTVPMDMRRDALAGTAEMIAMIEKTALAHFADRMVATVGQIEAAPGATNIIPGRVTFSIDLRSADDARRREALVKIEQEARRIAAARGLEVSFEPQFDTAHTPCAPHLQNAIERAILDLGHKPVRLVSGAGHDAQMMARLCPMAMVFVRCRGGISHNPAEFASEADIGAGIAALIRFIARLAAEPRA